MKMHAHRDPSIGRLRPRSVPRATIVPAATGRPERIDILARAAQGVTVAILAVLVIAAVIVRFGR